MRRVIALAMALAACGDGPATAVDGGADGAADAAAGSVVRVTVTSGGLPRAGVRVVFQDPMSGVIADSLTGEAGSAMAQVPAGSFVTVVEPEAAPTGPDPPMTIIDRLDTFAGVQPGDDLHLDLDPTPTSTVFTVTVPADPGVTIFQLTSTCGGGPLGGGLPTQMSFANCHGAADLAVIGYDDVGVPLRGMYRSGQAITDHGVVTIAGAYEPLAQVAITSDPPPSWVAQIGFELRLRTQRGTVFEASGFADPATPALTMAAPAAPGTTYAARATLYPQSTALAKQDVIVWGLPPGDVALALTGNLLAPFATPPVLDLASRTVSWTEDAGAAADLVRSQFHAFRDGAPAHAWDWQIVGPRGASPSITYPALPAAAGFNFLPTARDSFAVRELETLRITGGYDAVRAHALHSRLDQVTGAATGRATYQTLFAPQQ